MTETRGIYDQAQAISPDMVQPDGVRYANTEAGKVSTGLVVTAGVVALVLTGGYVGKQIWDSLPHSANSPQGSRAYVKTLDIVPTDFHCLAEAAFDVSNSTARTKYTFKDSNGTLHSVSGFGATVQTGKVVQDSCIKSEGVHVKDGVYAGRPVKFVDLQISAMLFNTNFSEADTKIVTNNPPGLQFAGATIDAVSAVARATCMLGNNLSPELKWKCDAVNTFADWKDGKQANLERSLRVGVLTEGIAKKCAPNELKNILAAETDTYRRQAVAKGGRTEDVIVRPVDDEQKPTARTPDFTRSTRESLIQKGVITANMKGSPQVAFESIKCTPLSKPYQPIYPDK